MLDLRGAPSAISIAVIPSDHRSLCNKTVLLGSLPEAKQDPHTKAIRCCNSVIKNRSKYLEVICGVWVLITGYDLWSHPIWSANKSVPPTNGTVQLCTHTKINC